VDHGAAVESVIFLPTGGIFLSAGMWSCINIKKFNIVNFKTFCLAAQVFIELMSSNHSCTLYVPLKCHLFKEK
jgi:hypothetical protein